MRKAIEDGIRAKGFNTICGIDEVGRGPLAGPVTVAAVILPIEFDIRGLKDSKELTEKQREEWNEKILKEAIAYSIISKTPREIDELNILRATKAAMRVAVNKLHLQPDFILIDAVNIDVPGIPQLALIEGDAQCPSVAAASIIAKVARDRYMKEMDKKYPGYDFFSNVGYGTPKHREGLKKLGPCALHRMSFLKNFQDPLRVATPELAE